MNNEEDVDRTLNLIETHLSSIDTLLRKPDWKVAKFDTWFLRNQKKIQTKIYELREELAAARDNYFGKESEA